MILKIAWETRIEPRIFRFSGRRNDHRVIPFYPTNDRFNFVQVKEPIHLWMLLCAIEYKGKRNYKSVGVRRIGARFLKNFFSQVFVQFCVLK